MTYPSIQAISDAYPNVDESFVKLITNTLFTEGEEISPIQGLQKAETLLALQSLLKSENPLSNYLRNSTPLSTNDKLKDIFHDKFEVSVSTGNNYNYETSRWIHEHPVLYLLLPILCGAALALNDVFAIDDLTSIHTSEKYRAFGFILLALIIGAAVGVVSVAETENQGHTAILAGIATASTLSGIWAQGEVIRLSALQSERVLEKLPELKKLFQIELGFSTENTDKVEFISHAIALYLEKKLGESIDYEGRYQSEQSPLLSVTHQ